MKFSVDELKNVFNKDKIGDWVVKYKRQVAVGCVAFCLVVFAGVSLAGGSTSGKEGEASPAAADNGQSAEERPGSRQGRTAAGRSLCPTIFCGWRG